MGNCWKGVSDERLLESEKKMLSYVDLPVEHQDFDINNVVIDQQGNFIRTIQIGHKHHDGTATNYPKLVLVHGYGGSGVIFYKIIKPLLEAKLHLILIDIIGMGSSSRPEFSEEQTNEEVDQYFVNFIENWRIAMGDLKDFFLAGHSFGGYICGHYAKAHPHNIKKLLMLSPVGVVVKPEDFDINRPNTSGRGPPQWVRKIAVKAWEKKWSPFGAMRKSGAWIGKKMIKSYMNKRMSALSEQEFADMLQYMHQILMRDGSTEYAIFICFELGMWAKRPLEREDFLGSRELPIPVSFFYGDIDWMDKRGGERIVQKNKFFNPEDPSKGLSQVYIINESDHHLYFDNPKEFAEVLIKDIQHTLSLTSPTPIDYQPEIKQEEEQEFIQKVIVQA